MLKSQLFFKSSILLLPSIPEDIRQQHKVSRTQGRKRKPWEVLNYTTAPETLEGGVLPKATTSIIDQSGDTKGRSVWR